MTQPIDLLEAHLLGEGDWIAVSELCRVCELDIAVLVELADLGVVVPRGRVPDEWQLPATSLPRLRVASRLMRDLGVNVSGAALAIELLDMQHDLERQVRRLQRLLHP
jgi:chaperone modulatory protein CbpM